MPVRFVQARKLSSINRPIAVILTETLLSTPLWWMRSSTAIYASRVAIAASRSRTSSPRKSSVAVMPAALSSRNGGDGRFDRFARDKALGEKKEVFLKAGAGRKESIDDGHAAPIRLGEGGSAAGKRVWGRPLHYRKFTEPSRGSPKALKWHTRMAEEMIQRNWRVLIADDDPAICTLIDTVLRKGPYEMVMCNDAESALVAVDRQGPFDIIICDLCCPESPASTWSSACDRKKERAACRY